MPTSRSRLGIIFFTVFIDLVGFGIVLPILPYYAPHFGARRLGAGIHRGAGIGRARRALRRPPRARARRGGSVAAQLLLGLCDPPGIPEARAPRDARAVRFRAPGGGPHAPAGGALDDRLGPDPARLLGLHGRAPAVRGGAVRLA